MSVKIFFFYAHKDETLLTELKTHLIPLRQEGLIDFWYDRDISGGMKWEQQIKEQLNAAQIILLLISPDFMASDYINNVELKRALERDERGEARVIPVILRHASWKIPTLRNLQALPTDAKPIKSWSDLDEAFLNVTEGIRTVVLQLVTKPVSPSEVLFSQAWKGESEPASHTALSPQPVKPPHSLMPEAFSLLRTLTGHKELVHSVAFSPDGQTLASGSWDESIRLWDVASGQEVRTLWGHRDRVSSVAFSPDGQTLASGSADDTIKLWDVTTGQEVHTLTGHTGGVDSVAFSPDGKTLASGSGDQTIMLWDVATGQEVHTLTGHTFDVSSVAFSPDGQTLASGSWDETIMLWDVASGQEVHTLTGHTHRVFSVAFSPDGQTLASGCRDTTINIWGNE